ncbi:hypothetical protein PoB_004679300 [Plakobranchus ocellatus]|uniref:Uncharacterized protein n=1 Tax=Plakobranchus ocellatus TaxID=259542 RepID=A0AAV4BL46_9GAST|nr:hypothetical protein PoB_004679300 [Plakobranchus ocellatus]
MARRARLATQRFERGSLEVQASRPSVWSPHLAGQSPSFIPLHGRQRKNVRLLVAAQQLFRDGGYYRNHFATADECCPSGGLGYAEMTGNCELLKRS